MNIKRILSVIIATVMVISVLSACSAAGGASVPFAVDESGRFIYAVVRPHDSNLTEESGAKDIRAAIKENFEVGVTILKDSAITDFDGNYEILVGNTDREESAIALQRLEENRPNNAYDFIVASINEKIVIQAKGEETLAVATGWFVKTFCQSADTWAMLEKDYEFIYEHETLATSDVNAINGIDLGLYTVVLPVRTSYLTGMYAEDTINFYSKFGYKMEKIEDIDPAVKNEIIIGNTTRPESQAVEVEGDNYVIKVVNGNVVIKGGSDLATWRAAKHFYDEVMKIKEGKALNWSDGFIINGKYDSKEEGAMTLNWNDEFNGSSIDFNKWGEYAGMATQTETSGLGGFKCWQTPLGNSPYNNRPTADQLKTLIYQSGGYMHLATQRLNEIDFVGGQISTDYCMTFRYGVVEVYSKLPPVPCSLGYWINEAMMNSADATFADRFGGIKQARTCFTEVDIIENFGSSTSFNANVHRWWTDHNLSNGMGTGSGHDSLDGSKYSGKAKNNKKKVYDTERYEGDLSTDFHYYNMYWTEDFMKFSFDGKTFLDYQFDADPTGVGPYCLMTYFVTECQMGDASYGATYDPKEHEDYYEHIIDYIRIYQSEPSGAQLITAWPQLQEEGTLKITYPNNPINGTY